MYYNQIRRGIEESCSAEGEKILEKRLEELISNVTTYIPHELRTPLVSIMGFTQIISDDLDSLSREEILNMIQNIEKSSRRLYRTIEKFIDFAALECLSKEKNMNKELKESNLYAHTMTIKETVMHMAEKEDRKEDLVASLEDAELQIPDNYLELISKELFDNALKFTKAGSKLEVTGAKGPYTYQLEIKDCGIGITEEEISKIEPFRQFNRKTFQHNGNGLGLSIVRRITDIFACGFTIISQKDSFTIVKIDFPYKNKLTEFV
ncbi:MAG: sensor histidine kinase [Syntrophomonadaceae bacterium]